MAKIKVSFEELNKKSTEELVEIKKEIKLRLITSVHRYGIHEEKGFDPKQDRKNIARIETILKERER